MKFISLLFLSICLVLKAQAQDPRWTNLPTYDDKVMHYGFTLGLNASGFKQQFSSNYFADSLVQSTPNFVPGFSLGFIL